MTPAVYLLLHDIGQAEQNAVRADKVDDAVRFLSEATVYDFLVGYEVLGKKRQVVASVRIRIVGIRHVSDDTATPLDIHKAVAYPDRLHIITAVVLLKAWRYAAGSHCLRSGYCPLVPLGQYD